MTSHSAFAIALPTTVGEFFPASIIECVLGPLGSRVTVRREQHTLLDIVRRMLKRCKLANISADAKHNATNALLTIQDDDVFGSKSASCSTRITRPCD